MKTKYFLIYVFVGIAFLAVSAWVYFTRGKNAKAIKAKYRLGGILLTCMAMLSVASCAGIIGQVTCYDVAIEHTEDIISLSLKQNNPSYQYNEISPGDVFSVSIQVPTYQKYVLRVILNNQEGTELQRAVLEITETANTSTFEIPLSSEVTYKGEAIVQVQGVIAENPEELSRMAYGIQVINIL